MDASSRGRASFVTQANALFRKNLITQRRNVRGNIRIISYPVVVCMLLLILQKVVDSQLNKPANRCGCRCVDAKGDGSCENVCGIQYSDLNQVDSCPIPSPPPEWPALLQVPRSEYRAASGDGTPVRDLPDQSCGATMSCPATVLFTGGDQSLANSLASNLFTSQSSLNFSDLSAISAAIPGTDAVTGLLDNFEPAFFSDRPLYILQPLCKSNSPFTVPIEIANVTIPQDTECVQGLPLWRDNHQEINDQLFQGYRQGNTERMINEIVTAYDFLNSDGSNFNVTIWYNSTFKNETAWQGPPGLMRVTRSVNMASNSYLQLLGGSGLKMELTFTKEMPKQATSLSLDFASLLGPLFYMFVCELLFPVFLSFLVYEKQNNLRTMMKMHGLGDGPYWIISYAYFLLLSFVYVFLFAVLGSVIGMVAFTLLIMWKVFRIAMFTNLSFFAGLKFFSLNNFGIQFVFYFAFMNLQIVLAFILKAFFSDVRIAQSIAYIYILGSAFLAAYLVRALIEDTSFPRGWVYVLEIIPAFSLYGGLYEFSQYSFNGNYMGTSGMQWSNLNDSMNGMKQILVIMSVEWILLLPIAYYVDQIASIGSRIRKNPLLFLRYSLRSSPLPEQTTQKVYVEMQKDDVINEREKVEHLIREPSMNCAILCDKLKKVYPGQDGNKNKIAVQGLSLALPRGECFGLLGPNGAGKSTIINMLCGLIKLTSGNAFVEGFSVLNDLDNIYNSMGVCPQKDMLWDMLTGREHLLFYGRLKNLRGTELMNAVDESLRSVGLNEGGFANQQVKKYSGGMKRRLSVAISLIGDPKVVYMDEPSTGLDPASRKKLWNAVKHAKQKTAIVLTTHSMEEAEFLCDRLGIFVNGDLECIGNPKELKARYGGTYVFTITTSIEQEKEVEALVYKLSPNANKIQAIAGSQKFELPKQEVRIADVFSAVEMARRRLTVQEWGLADTTMEDVFIKVARGAGSIDESS